MKLKLGRPLEQLVERLVVAGEAAEGHAGFVSEGEKIAGLPANRHLHAEVIEDALRAYDCGPRRGARP